MSTANEESLHDKAGKIYKGFRELKSKPRSIPAWLVITYKDWYFTAREIVQNKVPDKLEEFDNLYEVPGKSKVTRYNYRIRDFLDFNRPCPGLTRAGTVDIIEWLFFLQERTFSSICSVTEVCVFDSSNNSRILEQIIKGFHEYVRALSTHPRGRKTLQITDEHDVQYLLYALLKLFIADVRKEEWTPSYAGGANRIDFLLKKDGIGIETKMTRSNHKDKDIGDELIIDIQHYKQRKDCNCLWCLIYDPSSYIENREGLLNDLKEMSSPDFHVIPVISP